MLRVIDNSTIQRLLADPQLVAAVPCLQHHQQVAAGLQPGPGCPACQKAALAQKSMQLYDQTKRCLSQLQGAALSPLKLALDATELKVIVTAGKQTQAILF